MSIDLKPSTLPTAIYRSQGLKIAAVALSAVPLILVLLYHHAYAVNAPVWWTDAFNLPVAVAIRNGNLIPLHVIFAPVGDHNLVASRIVGALSVLLTDWNMRVDALINPLIAAVNVAMAFILFRRHKPELAYLALIPFSALILSLRQENNWLVALNVAAYIPGFCLLLSLVILDRITYPRLIVAGLLAFIGMFSYLAGLTLWPIILLVIWGSGERRWQPYALWIALMVASLAVMFLTGDTNIDSEGQTVSRLTNFHVSLSDLPTMLAFVLRGVANSLAYGTSAYFRPEGLIHYQEDGTLALITGTLGVIFWVMNIVYLYRRGFDRGQLAVWVALGLYAIGVIIMICLGRLQSTTIPGIETDHSLNFWYVTHALWFWVSLVALMLLALTHRPPRSLIAANAAALIAIAVLYVRVNAMSLNFTISDWGHGFGTSINTEVEDCLFQAAFTRDYACIPPAAGYQNVTTLDSFAALKVGPFAHREAVSILPEPITPATRVIIETSGDHAWLAIHIRDWLLAGLSADQVYAVIPNLYVPAPTDLPQPLGEIATEPDPASTERLAAFLADSPEFWYVEQVDEARTSTAFSLIQRIQTDQVYEVSQEPIEANGLTFALTHFDAATREMTHEIGGEMGARLHGWSLRNDVQVQPCQPITVESWWSVQTPLVYHSVTLAIADANGVGITAVDGPPMGLGFEHWQPNWVYRDVRTLTMPCDAASGEYLLLSSLYQLEPFSAGVPLYLTTLIIP